MTKALPTMEKVRLDAFKAATKELASKISIGLEERFEDAGCSCNVDRQRLIEQEKQASTNPRLEAWSAEYEALKAEHYRYSQEERRVYSEMRELERAMDGERVANLRAHPEIKALREAVRKVDAAEHPALDKAAREARPFITMWLFEQIEAQSFDLNPEVMRDRYVHAWMGGWRPK